MTKCCKDSKTVAKGEVPPGLFREGVQTSSPPGDPTNSASLTLKRCWEEMKQLSSP